MDSDFLSIGARMIGVYAIIMSFIIPVVALFKRSQLRKAIAQGAMDQVIDQLS